MYVHHMGAWGGQKRAVDYLNLDLVWAAMWNKPGSSVRTASALNHRVPSVICLYLFVQLCFSTRQVGQQTLASAFSMLPAVSTSASKRNRKGKLAWDMVTFTELAPQGPLMSEDQSNNNRMTVVTLKWTVHVEWLLLPNTSNFTHFTKALRDTLLQKKHSA